MIGFVPVQTRRPIENGATKISEEDSQLAIVKRQSGQNSSLGLRELVTNVFGPFHRTKHLVTAAFRC
jgi:hypothetical protein